MPRRIVLLKQEGTHPAAEGLLAPFADVCAIRSMADMQSIAKSKPDIVLVDIALPEMDGQQVLDAFRQDSRHEPLIVFLGSWRSPGELRQQLVELGRFRGPAKKLRRDVPHLARVLGLTQEALARVLNVSARTAHRWLKGARPRKRPELEQLGQLVALLEQALPSTEAIRAYLHHPNPNMGGERPVDLLLRREFDRVAADLEALQEGVYV